MLNSLMIHRHTIIQSILFSAVVLIVFSCEKASVPENNQSSDGKVTVTFQISQIEQIDFSNTTTRSAELDSFVSRLSVAVFQGDKKVQMVSQMSDESSFGSVSMSLTPGEYKLVAIAHNGKGNCSITSPDKVTFQNSKVTDTFYYYSTLNVTESTITQMEMKRPVAMFRLKVTGKMPSDVVQMKFNYTGGSSSFNAVSGFGYVNSKQEEVFSIDSTYYGKPSQFEIYTFPHEANDFIDVDYTALDKTGSVVAEGSMENMYIQPNKITQHTETFFEESSEPEDSVSVVQAFTLFNDGKWDGTIVQ